MHNIFLALGQCFILIGNKTYSPSFGSEFAYWNIDHFPYSVDFGFDCQKGKFRVYSEAQTGVGFAGISAGPVLEFKRDSPVQLGLQTSFWANYILGADLKWIFLKGQNYFSSGVYLKYPWVSGGNNNNSSNSYNDFDWD